MIDFLKVGEIAVAIGGAFFAGGKFVQRVDDRSTTVSENSSDIDEIETEIHEVKETVINVEAKVDNMTETVDRQHRTLHDIVTEGDRCKDPNCEICYPGGMYKRD